MVKERKAWVVQSMWSQGVGHNLGNEQQQKKMGKVMTQGTERK